MDENGTQYSLTKADKQNWNHTMKVQEQGTCTLHTTYIITNLRNILQICLMKNCAFFYHSCVKNVPIDVSDYAPTTLLN